MDSQCRLVMLGIIGGGGVGWKWVEVGGSGCHQDSGVVCVWGREEGAGGVILARYRQRPPDSSPSFRDRCSSAAD